ncbi:MAG TPA: acyl-CoA dehydrogenase family protein [Acidimicrobiia bacterium]|nr:acyl-CoA dehydrogenase family protein [Acidimicrobiia bacterium]
MDLDLSDDQVALRDGIASMLAARVPMDRVRSGFDRALAAELADAGVFTLRRDGFAWADAVVVFEQLGRACVPGPLVDSTLLGDGRSACLVSDQEPIWIECLDAVDVLVVWRAAGLECVVPGAVTADTSPWPLDPATPMARARSLPAGVPLDLGRDIRELVVAGAALTAAYQLGLADRVAEMAVAYARERVQFDRPIGSFQAIKHICADMLVRTEVARAAVYAAGAHLDERATLPGIERSVNGAKLLAGEAAIANGKAATQVYGGMGYTWEVDVHLYLKRAWLLDTRFGSVDRHAADLADVVRGRR